MENDTFTVGIDHGGLTTDFEIRMLVCWLLNKTKANINLTLLNEALASYALVNYFELSRAISDLKNSGHITEDNNGIINEEEFFNLLYKILKMYQLSYSPNLKWEVKISWSKNAALPIVAANYLLDFPVELLNKYNQKRGRKIRQNSWQRLQINRRVASKAWNISCS